MKLLCKDCHKYFEFSEGEQRFYALKNLHKPKRCPRCRVENKARREDPYAGWESTMRTGFIRKTRHTHVHYAPHTVGGFR
ncbi:MAG: hypothetical protein E7328_07325 [Clostridiales bacterium]|nr:hypothetical protein [Clostridiales bacterium]